MASAMGDLGHVRPRRPRQGRRLSDGTVIVTTPDDNGRIVHAIRYDQSMEQVLEELEGELAETGLRRGRKRRGRVAVGARCLLSFGGSRGLGDAKSYGSSSSLALGRGWTEGPKACKTPARQPLSTA